jgi:SAM-dependent methyltransferase
MQTYDMKTLVRKYIEESNNLDVQSYGGNFLRHYERGRWLIEHMMDLGRIRNSRVLDVGCGFGWQALIIAISGNNDVVANDIRESMTSVVASRVAALNGAMSAGRVTPLLGDICSLDIAPASFDAIFSNQAVEHIHDLDRFFARAARALKPGGRMVIANDNNALNRRQFEEVTKMWLLRDRSAEYVDRLKRERPIENADAEPYATMRENVIRRANPNLSSADVARIADATAGMLDAEVEAVARSYAPGGRLPEPPAYAWSRNPTTGEYCERQLNPYELRENIDGHGFDARVRHAYRRFPLRLWNGVQFRPLNSRLFNHRSQFIIVAVRRPEGGHH